jgi:hypothetical protein
MDAYERSLKELETWLGEDHNLVVLEETALKEPGLSGNAADAELFLKLIAKYHKELRAQALALGKHIYAEKPRQLTRRFQRLWDAGH